MMSKAETTNSNPTGAHIVQTILKEVRLARDEESGPENGSLRIAQSALAALKERRVSELVAHFHRTFRFNDHALKLEFTDKLRLTGFLEKSRELFPDTTLEIISIFAIGKHVIAEWKLAATQTVASGSVSYRIPFSMFGSTIILVENEKIVQWSDYYDQNASRRISLAAQFMEWIEY